jgi:hypothetical protein
MPAMPDPVAAASSRASSFPSETEVAQIAELTNAAFRNQQITEAYWKLSAEVARRISGHANWCTFATWASRQAGVTIRHEDLANVLRERLRQSWKIGGFEAWLINLLLEVNLDVLQLVVDSVSEEGPLKRSSEAVGDGNRKVFEEIGLQFARWLTQFPNIQSITGAEMEAFSSKLTDGRPPQGQDLLRQAFDNYRAASLAQDPKERAELILLANLRIGYHEQVRLQHDIKASLDGALIEPSDLAARLVPKLSQRPSKAARAINVVWFFGESPLQKVTKALVKDVHLEVRKLITENLMSLWLPPADVVQLGRDLARPFPDNLRTLANADVRQLLASFDPTPASESGSGAQDWANLHQRMRFIANLFRAYGEEKNIFEAPSITGAASPKSERRRIVFMSTILVGMTVLLLIPLVTVAVRSLYFVYAFIMDRALAHFVHQTARKAFDRARSDPSSSPEQVRGLHDILEKREREDFEGLLDSWSRRKKIRNK